MREGAFSEMMIHDCGLSEQGQIAGDVELVVLESALETGYELAAKHAPEHLNGGKEARAGSNPVGVSSDFCDPANSSGAP
jgi:hypothetical protein